MVMNISKRFFYPNISRPPISSSSDSGSAAFLVSSLAGALPPLAGALAGAAAAAEAANFDGSFKNSFN
jgi:hypothetical protein